MNKDLADGSQNTIFALAWRLWGGGKHFHTPIKANNPTNIQTGYQTSYHHINLPDTRQLHCPLA